MAGSRFEMLKAIDPDGREDKKYSRLLLENRCVDLGELEAIVIC